MLCLYGLADAGLIGPDEPRYADIGRAMYESGDWITPRLFGEPWFEKPALLYWLIAAGFAMGADDTLAPRFPIAILGLTFLAFYFMSLRRLLGEGPALASSVILATTVGWLGFSHAAVTDLPLTVFFAAGMLFSMPWALNGERRWLPVAAACFAMASLAKGLVPLVLAAPLLFFGWRRVRDWLRPAPLFAFAVVSIPWYAFCYWRNGAAFVDEFFWKHHISRFLSPELQHVQPAWFYLPVLLGLLVPSTPLLLLLIRHDVWNDPRLRYFAAWAGFGFLFFSASTNKLPGYLLPLLPAIAAMLGMALDRIPRARVVLPCVALLSAVYALAGGVLPEALASGIRSAELPPLPWAWASPAVVAAGMIFWMETKQRRSHSLSLLFVVVTLNVALLKTMAFPVIDHEASSRQAWEEVADIADRVCIERLHRATEYGIRYYSHGRVPLCSDVPRPLHLREGIAGRMSIETVAAESIGPPASVDEGQVTP